MKTLLLSTVASLLAMTPPVWAAAAGSAEPAGDVIDLPPFEVRGTFPWTYVAAPGYEVLSLARDRETRATMDRFLRAIRVGPIFVPPGWETKHSEPVVLFLHHFDGESTLEAVRQAQEYSFMPDNISVTQGGVMVSLPGERVTQNWMRSRRSPLADHVSWTLVLQPQTVPPWYHKGIHGLLSLASVYGASVEVPGIRWEQHELMPLADVLAVTSIGELSQLERGPQEVLNRFVSGAILFVRWGFFDENGRKRSALFSLVDEASKSPLTDEMFARVFGLSVEQAQAELTLYANEAAQQRTGVNVPNDMLAEVPDHAEVKPATHAQVARLLGRFYFLLGAVSFPDRKEQYFEKARSTYRDSFPVGETDLRLMSDLGYLDYVDGKHAEAIPRLESALDDSVTDSRALIALSRLRLKAAISGLEEGAALSEEQFEAIVTPLRKAMRQRPLSKEAYVIGAALWLNRETVPSAGDLALLEEGARTFSRVPQIVIPVVELHKLAGRTAVASDLIALLLELPNLTDEARSVLLEEQAALQGTGNAP